VSFSSAAQQIARAASDGDIAQRRQRAGILVGRWIPHAAALACALALVAAWLDRARFGGVAFLSVTAVGALVVLLLARRERTLTDRVVADLDRAADLGGALRSAHWFAVENARQPQADGSEWLAFHVDSAAARAGGIDWARVFLRPSETRRALVAMVFAAATVAATVWPAPIRAALGGGPASPSATELRAEAIPAALLPQLVEGMRAIKEGRPPSKEALAAIGQALEIAKGNEALRSELDHLFAEVGDFEGDTGFFDQSREGYELRALYDDQGYPMDPSLEWAYQDASAKTSADRFPMKEGATDPSGDGESSARGAEGDAGEREAGLGSPDPGGDPGQGEGGVASFSSLLFGKQPSSGAGKGSPQAAASNMASLMAALRREVVNAQRDVNGTSGGRGDRRATNAATARANTVSGTIDTTYDQARATRPPAVPEDRRTLVHDFFRREADPKASTKQP
jgi:hypothetical protein